MILIDTNALIVLILGMVDPRLIRKHKRTSLYDEHDFYELVSLIQDFEKLVILPNVWTEADNLLNRDSRGYKEKYVMEAAKLISRTKEIYIASETAVSDSRFFDLGLTDTLILHQAAQCELLITSDSKLSDYATAWGVRVFDMVKNKNERL